MARLALTIVLIMALSVFPRAAFAAVDGCLLKENNVDFLLLENNTDTFLLEGDDGGACGGLAGGGVTDPGWSGSWW